MLDAEEVGPDRSFVAEGKSGDRIRGTVSRFGYRSAFVDFPNSCSVAEGDEISELRFWFGDQMLSSGRGTIGMIFASSAGSVEAEINIRGAWKAAVNERGNRQNSEDFGLPEQFENGVPNELYKEWSLLSANYRLAVHDLGEVLSSVYNEASVFESAHREEDISVAKLRADSAFVEKTAKKYGEIFWNAVQRFEKAALEVVDTDLQVLAKEFARRILYPYTLSSPFLSRVVERPIGVPGDYGMLGQILGNPLEGYTIYDRIVNAWILSCGAASAYRYRVSLLHREILESVRECADNQKRAKVLSMASGVAYEIQRFIENPPEIGEVDFTMVDFSTVTLEEAKRQYASLGSYRSGISVRMEESSVIELANRSRSGSSESYSAVNAGGYPDGEFEPDNDYDLVYCAGLFDYLSDRLITKVIIYLFSCLRPGGRIVISNFTTKNPIRAWMTYVMDWNLIYRSKEGFSKLVANALPEGSLHIETDDDGVEVYAIVRKLGGD